MRTKARHTTTNPCLLSLLFSPNTIAVGDVHLSRNSGDPIKMITFSGRWRWLVTRTQPNDNQQPKCCDWSPQFYKTTRWPLNLFGNMVSFSTSLFRSFFFPCTFVLFSLFLSFFLSFFFLPCSASLIYSFFFILFIWFPSFPFLPFFYSLYSCLSCFPLPSSLECLLSAQFVIPLGSVVFNI